MNLTKEIGVLKNKSRDINTTLSKIYNTKSPKLPQLIKDLALIDATRISYQNYIAKVLDAIIELYKREDKKVVGVPSSKDYIKHRKALDSLVFSKEGNIVHLQIREDMDKSSYKITILENDQLKAERL